jgi:hypothetical protein
VWGFDKHRDGLGVNVHPDYGRSCLTNEQLSAKGFERNARGLWRMPLSPEASARMKSAWQRAAEEEE